MSKKTNLQLVALQRAEKKYCKNVKEKLAPLFRNICIFCFLADEGLRSSLSEQQVRTDRVEYSVSTWYCFIYHAVLQSRTADVTTAPTVSNLVIIYTLESVLFVRAKHTHTFCTSNLNNDSFTFRDQKDNRVIEWSVSVSGLQDDFGTKFYSVREKCYRGS